MPKKRPLFLNGLGLALLGFTAVSTVCVAAEPENHDPIQLNDTQWAPAVQTAETAAVDAGHKKNQTPSMSSLLGLDTTPKSGVTLAVTPPPTAVTDKSADAQPSAAPAVAAPVRPINIPVMPAVVNNFGLQIDSTAEAVTESPAQIVTKEDGESDIALDRQNWRDAAETAREQADQLRNASSDGERVPLNVRLTYLPNPKIIPNEKPTRPLRQRLTEMPAPPKQAVPETKKQPTPECAAIDTYKKKQLEAIQSDRKTLEALQSAIADLGLQKQLNFMAGSKQSEAQSTPVPTTLPVVTP